ncbi:MAG: YHS domain-containing protein, partial [Gammaproteobacteria bacterium]
MADHDHRCGTHRHPNGTVEGRLVTTDPVCRMAVKPDTAFRMAYAGNTYLFCSDGCLERFRSAPERYLEPAAPAIKAPRSAASPAETSGRYTCPMHPEVESPRPGGCPKCGM